MKSDFLTEVKYMYNKREERIRVFEDTIQFIKEDPALFDAVKASREKTVIYGEGSLPELSPQGDKECRVTVTRSRTLEAAMNAHKDYPDARICVLNFASATNPGGGVTKGSSAQEESLCRCSTLYPVLNSTLPWQMFYGVNRQSRDPLHTDDCIYTPDIVICKSDDESPKRLKEQERVTVDVITCAAPNLRNKTGNAYNTEYVSSVSLTLDDLYRLHLKRAKHIIHTAAFNNADILILGAFGCGAFENAPETVARAMNDALTEYRRYFTAVEFAVYCTERDISNYSIFSKIIVQRT